MTRDSGAIYRVWRDGRVEPMTPRSFGIANTMAWTRDGRFLTADTLKNEMYAYDYSRSGLRERRLFAAGFERGFPDGSCLDAQERLWNCRVAGGACLAAFLPSGALERIVELPCSWPTSCAFGGARVRDALCDVGAVHAKRGSSARSSAGRRAIQCCRLRAGTAGEPVRLRSAFLVHRRQRRPFARFASPRAIRSSRCASVESAAAPFSLGASPT